MTLEDFFNIYKFEFTGQVVGNSTYIAITKVIRISNNIIVDGIRSSIDLYEMNNIIDASQSPFSATPWNWDDIIDQTKRAQLDYFAQRVPIEEFFPRNSETDISRLV